MEDSHITLPELTSERWRGVAMFGVMDGHGGEQVARFAERHLPEELQAFDLSTPEGPPSNNDLSAALTNAFHRIDDLLRDRSSTGAELQALTLPPVAGAMSRSPVQRGGAVDPHAVGCTCVISCITESHFVVANAGDSRAVLCRAGKAVPLSEDHKPNNPGERSRIVAAGGYIETQQSSSGPMYRVNGNLNLSRALGDLEYKRDSRRGPEQQIISGTPDVSITKRSAEDEFLLICCDGVWDMKTDQQAVDFVKRRLPTDPDADPNIMAKILGELLDDCLSPDLKSTKGLGGDNMTAVVVRLPKQGTFSASRATVGAQPTSGSGARLVDVQCEERSVTSGDVKVRLQLLQGCSCEDLRFNISARTADIELHVSGVVVGRFSLRNELPSRAELMPGNEAVKFHRKSSTVRCRIPWLIPSKSD